MRRLLSIPIVEIFSVMCVGFISLGICLSVDGCRQIIQQRRQDEADRTFVADMADKEWKANARQRERERQSPGTLIFADTAQK